MSTKTGNMIELRELEFAYPNGTFQLHIDQLTVQEGAQTCWVGPSGAGKTTLLHLVAGIISPDHGDVMCGGANLTSMNESSRREFRVANIGLVFQDFALLDYLSVLDNILLPYRISGMQLDGEARDRAKHLAESVGLSDKLKRPPAKLSQGERQRIAVCRAIVARPKIVLADEPTANLDSMNTDHVLNSLRSYCSDDNATLIIVSHDQLVKDRFDDQVDVAQYCSSTAESGSTHHA